MYDGREGMKYKGELDGMVLGVLQSTSGHGYEIAKRIKAISEGELSVAEAKLYPCLHRLEEGGLVEAEWVPQQGKPSRKVYSITEKGRGALVAKRQAWQRFASAVSEVLASEEGNRG
jgi:DNA-binding PadR family transcriptional regulator